MGKNKRKDILYIAEESDDCLSDDNIVWLKLCSIQLLESDTKALLTFGHQLNDKHSETFKKILLLILSLYQRFLKAKITTKNTVWLTNHLLP